MSFIEILTFLLVVDGDTIKTSKQNNYVIMKRVIDCVNHIKRSNTKSYGAQNEIPNHGNNNTNSLKVEMIFSTSPTLGYAILGNATSLQM